MRILAILLLLIALVVAIPGLLLLRNQAFGNHVVVQFAGRPIGTWWAIATSLGAAAFLGIMALAVLSIGNRRDG